MYELPGVGPRPMVRVSERHPSMTGDPEVLIAQSTVHEDARGLRVARTRTDSPQLLLSARRIDSAAYDSAVARLPFLDRQPLSAQLAVGDIAVDLLGRDAIAGAAALGDSAVVRMIARIGDDSPAAHAIRRVATLVR